jgi:ElaB/YqjD/DUF883 family membrane-anchored ribosome-binding protein
VFRRWKGVAVCEEHSSLIQVVVTNPAQSERQREMTTANENLPRAASSTARNAADTAQDVAENVSEFANDLTRKAEKQFSRARNMAADVYEEAHEASKEYPHVTLALAAGFGFLLGVLATRR